MAETGIQFEMPVSLTVGGTTSQVGTITATLADVSTELPKLLRAVADEIEAQASA